MANTLKNRHSHNFMTAYFMKYKASLWSTILFSYKSNLIYFDWNWIQINAICRRKMILEDLRKKGYLYFWWFRFINDTTGRELLKIWSSLSNVNAILVSLTCLTGEVKAKSIYCWTIKSHKLRTRYDKCLK